MTTWSRVQSCLKLVSHFFLSKLLFQANDFVCLTKLWNLIELSRTQRHHSSAWPTCDYWWLLMYVKPQCNTAGACRNSLQLTITSLSPCLLWRTVTTLTRLRLAVGTFGHLGLGCVPLLGPCSKTGLRLLDITTAIVSGACLPRYHWHGYYLRNMDTVWSD